MTRAEIDAGAVIEAAERAEVLWEAEAEGEGRAYTLSSTLQAGADIEPDDSE